MPASINQSDFDIITKALSFFSEQKSSLFADQLIGRELGDSYESIRERMIKWSGVTPEKLIAYLDPVRVKKRIEETIQDIKSNRTVVPDVQIENMRTDELAGGGKELPINYHFYDTLFGRIITASTTKGICFLAFSDGKDEEALYKLQQRFPQAVYQPMDDKFQSNALSLFGNGTTPTPVINLHIKGTPFQIKTWKKLLQIPSGGLMSYGALADDPRYSHPLGAAVGANPVAYIIPCHRAVPATGKFGEYHWGSGRKAALISWEASQREKISQS